MIKNHHKDHFFQRLNGFKEKYFPINQATNFNSELLKKYQLTEDQFITVVSDFLSYCTVSVVEKEILLDYYTAPLGQVRSYRFTLIMQSVIVRDEVRITIKKQRRLDVRGISMNYKEFRNQETDVMFLTLIT